EAGRLQAAIAEASVELELELEAQVAARAAAAHGIPAALIERYEALRARLDGVGAARLVHGTCSGCHLALPATELDRLRRQPPDAVVFCEQCGRILVRAAATAAEQPRRAVPSEPEIGAQPGVPGAEPGVPGAEPGVLA
ncbi:MAG: zinc ribbon domain-containing protein, partial [Acidimicrobiales bacterium]